MRTRASDSRRTFTELARRAQIAGCAAEAIAEVGYADASMAEIARRAGVAKSVVSYHFSDRAELMGEVLRTALATYAKFMEPRMAGATSVSDKLRAYRARLVQLNALIRKFGARPIYVTQPRVDGRLVDGQWQQIAGSDGARDTATVAAINRTTLAFCRDTGATCIDLAGQLDFAPGDHSLVS